MLGRIVDVAKAAARDAGDEILRAGLKDVVVEKTKSCAQDLATETDCRCQAIIAVRPTSDLRLFPLTHAHTNTLSVTLLTFLSYRPL
jgi:hypothetical protein